MIQDSSEFGQEIMPKYYTIASGESPVYLKSMFMTEIEALECRDPYFKEKFKINWEIWFSNPNSKCSNPFCI